MDEYLCVCGEDLAEDMHAAWAQNNCPPKFPFECDCGQIHEVEIYVRRSDQEARG